MLERGIFLLRAFSTRAFQYRTGYTGPKNVKQNEERNEIRKSIKVAFVGHVNAGKSTLINTMLGLKICATSKRPLTTQEFQHVFLVQGDTQVILLDTPGILSNKLRAKSDCEDSEFLLQTQPVQKADLVGMIVDSSGVNSPPQIDRYIQLLTKIFPSKTQFILILNKVDLIKDKPRLLHMAKKFYNSMMACREDSNLNEKKEARKFSQIFMVSALKNDGVEHIVQYLRSIAPELPNSVSQNLLSDHPDEKIVQKTVRAALLEHVEYEIPYKCTCQVEHMAESPAGEMQIVVLLKCPTTRCYTGISKARVIEQVQKDCVKNLGSLFGREVLLRLEVVQTSPKRRAH